MTIRVGHLLFRLGSGLWLGAIFFFFVAVAPKVFQVVSMPASGHFIDQVFPMYYAIGLWFGGAAMVGAILVAWFSHTKPSWVVAAGAIISWIMVVYAHALLHRMNRLNPSSGQFAGLHHLSIVINTVIMIVIVASMAVEALLG